jgi:hypothetical protein
MFGYITNNILSDKKSKKSKKKIIGGYGNEDDTEPYHTFHKTLDNVYGYLQFVYKNCKINRNNYETSLANLDEKCNCEDYKCKKDSIGEHT